MEHPKCAYCSSSNATHLLFYSKNYGIRDTIESPILSCDECIPKAKQDLSVDRGGFQGVFYRTFRMIGEMSERQIGYFCSKKGKEVNHLANKQWKGLIFRIHYLNLPPKKQKEDKICTSIS